MNQHYLTQPFYSKSFSFCSFSFGVGHPFIMWAAEIFPDISGFVALLQVLGQESVTYSGWKTSRGVEEDCGAEMPGDSGNQ